MNLNNGFTKFPENFDGAFKIQVTGASQISQIDRASMPTLVCEGGGQRGIFAAGILDSFMDQNFFPFRALIGASAGAQNLASYTCDQYGYAREAILRYTTTKKFYDPIRFARGGHLIDLDWYFNDLNQHMPLNIDYGLHRLVDRSFHMSASRRTTLEADYLSFQANDVTVSLKASCAIPLFYREAVVVDGVEYWDGGLTDSLPVKMAHSWGSDCVVLIRSQPRYSINALAMLPTNWKLKGLRQLGNLVSSYVKNYNASMNFIENPPNDLIVIDLAPVNPLQSRMFGSSQDALQHDYQLGLNCGRHFLEHYAWRF